MPDPRFYRASGPFAIAELAQLSGATVAQGADPSRRCSGVASLEAAGPDDVSFLDNRRYIGTFAASRAGACVVRPELSGQAPPGMALLLTPEPYKAYARIARAFYPNQQPHAGVHRNACLDPTATLGPDVAVGPGAVIGAGAEIGARCQIGPNALIGDGVVLGEDTTVGASASVSHSIIGARVVIYPGARIGQDGFGFAPDPSGHVKVPQVGRVLIGDDCEIGANTCIDRGSAADTVIGPGCMIDNLVQIGHNVRLGRGCVLVAQVGISGSTRLDDFVVVGGQGGLAGHLHIGSGAQIAAQSGVTRNVAAGQTVGGYPAEPIAEWRRMVAVLRRLAKRKGE